MGTNSLGITEIRTSQKKRLTAANNFINGLMQGELFGSFLINQYRLL
jgi:hypothetical protein